MAEPLQLPLFPDRAALIRVRPDRDETRFCRMEVWPDLFGRALLVRHCGQIGTKGRRRLDPHPDPGAAINALARSLRIVANGAEVEPQIAVESVGMGLSLYFQLRERGSASHAASLLRQLRPRSKDTGAYHTAVAAAWTSFDKIPHGVAMVADVSAALGNAV